MQRCISQAAESRLSEKESSEEQKIEESVRIIQISIEDPRVTITAYIYHVYDETLKDLACVMRGLLNLAGLEPTFCYYDKAY